MLLLLLSLLVTACQMLRHVLWLHCVKIVDAVSTLLHLHLEGTCSSTTSSAVVKCYSGSASTNVAPPSIELIAKLEAFDCLQHLDEIIRAADGIMVARGDLGAQVMVEQLDSL